MNQTQLHTKPYRLDILIVTQGRHLFLKRGLESLLRATKCEHFKFHIYILINGSDFATRKMLDQLQQKIKASGSNSADCKISIYESPQTLKPGLARNTLLKHSTGDWVYFMDDDAYPDQNLFVKFGVRLQENRAAILFGGPNLTPHDSNLFQQASGLVLGSSWGTLWTNARYAPVGVLRHANEAWLSSCNLFIRSDVFQSNLYPNHYRTAEESYLILEILKSWPQHSWYDPNLIVYHDRRRSLPAYLKQIFGYAAGRGQLIFDGRTRSIVYLIPSAVLVALGHSLWFANLQTLIVAFLKIYLMVTLLFTIMALVKTKARRIAATCAFILFPITHTAYAAGMIMGLMRPTYKVLTAKMRLKAIVNHD